MLVLLSTLPLVGALGLAASASRLQGYLSRGVALGVAITTIVATLVVWGHWLQTVNANVDALSAWLIVLTSSLFPIAHLSGYSTGRSMETSYSSLLLALESILLIVFLSGDLMTFYVAFEASLVPVVISLGVWGSGAARLRAAYLFFLYTLAGSLAMLLAILFVWLELGSLTFDSLASAHFASSTQAWLWFAFALSFAVKTPLYPFHLWLYRAHAEAPVAMSVLLAGVVLKLATFGFVRVCLELLPEASLRFQPLVFAIASVTLVLSCLSVTRQSDVKAVIALSSVGHMAIVTVGLFALSPTAASGGLLLSLAHGLVSPALFVIVGGVLYERYHTRVFRYFRGLTLLMPLSATFFFLASCANIAIPTTLNWISEVLVVVGLYLLHPLLAVLSGSSVLLGAVYSVWLYSRIAYGRWSPSLKVSSDLSRREMYCLFGLLLAVFVGGILTSTLTDSLNPVGLGYAL